MTFPTHEAFAIVGLSCRLPGAPDLAAYERLLDAGACAVRRFTRAELLAAGLPPALVDDPRYVPATGALEGVEDFDAAHFGFSPREAALLDPQHRKLFECAYEALEGAGLLAEGRPRDIGVFATSGMALYLGRDMRTYFRHNVVANPEAQDALDPLQLMMLHEKVWLPTQLSYRLGLTGPSLSVQTACSSSIVALHLALESLRRGECSAALVGASAIHAPHHAGYLHVPGSIFSPDGDCRPFSDGARGIVGGCGVGVVVLCRLDDALRRGLRVRALVAGTAINNDGARKATFTAPSVLGQKGTILGALAAAGLERPEIGYVEAHGTGTLLGDPVEVQAFTQAFAEVGARGSCALGSVKANIGHLDTAAGMASLIKAVLALEGKKLFRQRGCERLNPHIDFASTPFFVPGSTEHWPEPASGSPRTAMVAALGAGGTNAHAVLLEWSQPAAVRRAVAGTKDIGTPPEDTAPPLLYLSAKSPEGLAAQAAALAATLAETLAETRAPQDANPSANGDLASFCDALHARRELLPHRAALPARTGEELVGRLQSLALGKDDPLAPIARFAPRRGTKRGLVFVYSGQGAQLERMGADLYASSDVFREAFDRCDTLFARKRGESLLGILHGDTPSRVHSTEITQPALFAYQFAYTRMLEAAGVKPGAVVGHSVGEYMAAVAAGILGFEDAFDLLEERASLMGRLPAGGGMLALPVDRVTAQELLAEFGRGLDAASFNGPGAVVVAGRRDALAAFRAHCEARGVGALDVNVSHAFHSREMEPVLSPLSLRARTLTYASPRIPIVTNADGALAGDRMSTPEYWVEQVRAPVAFDLGIATLSRAGWTRFIEIAPRPVLGRSLRALAPEAVVCGAHPKRAALSTFDDIRAHDAVEKGLPPSRSHAGDAHAETPLPPFAFVRARHWLEPIVHASPRVESPAFELHRVVWAPRATQASNPPREHPDTTLVFVHPSARDAKVEFLGLSPAALVPLDENDVASGTFASKIEEVLQDGAGRGGNRRSVGVRILVDANRLEALPACVFVHGVLSSVWTRLGNDAWDLSVIAFDGFDPRGDLGDVLALPASDALETPAFAALRALLDSARLEEPAARLSLVALPRSRCATLSPDSFDAARALASAALGPADTWLERRLQRSETTGAPTTSPARRFENATCLITGAFGGLGLELMEALADAGASSLALVGRTPPDARARERLDRVASRGVAVHEVLSSEPFDAGLLRALRRSDAPSSPRTVHVFHLAGALRDGLVPDLAPEAFEAVFDAKTALLESLLDVLRAADRPVALTCFSSVAAALGAPGQGNYAAANAAMESLAWRAARLSPDWKVDVVRWTGISGVGMAERTHSLTTTRRTHPTLEAGAALAALVGGALPTAHSMPGAASAGARLVCAAGTWSVLQAIETASLDDCARAFWLGITPPPHDAPRASPSTVTQHGSEHHAAVPTSVEAILTLARNALSDITGHPTGSLSDAATFTESGLDSLGLVRLVGVLSHALKLRLSPSVAYNHPTPRSLAEALAALLLERSAPATPPLPVTTPPLPTFSNVPAPTAEPIAVVGAGCRLPGGIGSPEALWQALESGFSPVGPLPRSRIDMRAWFGADHEGFERRGSYFDDVSSFDPLLFGISPREAADIDPQHRMLTDVTFDALEHAGIPLGKARELNTGLYYGIGTDDFAHMNANETNLGTQSPYALLGGNRGVGVGRISYLFGFTGPAIAYDTTCSSSLVAIHQAAQALRAREVDLAFAGGVHLVLSPVGIVGRCGLEILSTRGECRAFDDGADGFVQGEGCVVVALKRLSDARRDGDEVMAILRGSAVNQNGGGNGLQAPNGLAQERLLRQALTNAGLTAGDVDYVEAHGTGTRLGDPIELDALSRVYGAARPADAPLLVGSVKTNFGHLEPAAGALSFLKVVLALAHGTIPAQLHFEKPNAHVGWAALGVQVASRARSWPRSGTSAIAGVSSFGIAGTNAHALLEADFARGAEGTDRRATELPREDGRVLALPLSAKSDGALDALALAYREALVRPESDAIALCHAAATRRTPWKSRSVVWGRSAGELAAHLDAFARSQDRGATAGHGFLRASGASRTAVIGVVFKTSPLPSGVRIPSRTPLAALYEEERARAQAVVANHGLTASELGSLSPLLDSFALDVAQYRLLTSAGLEGATLVGHGRGDYAAAHCAGLMAHGDAIHAFVARERALTAAGPSGRMISVFADRATVEDVLRHVRARAWVAVDNGPRSCVVSCADDDFACVLDAFEDRDLAVLPLEGSRALACPLSGPAAERVARMPSAATASPSTPTARCVSAASGDVTALCAADPAFWAASLVKPIEFTRAIHSMRGDDCPRVMVELGFDSFLSAAQGDAAGGPVVVVDGATQAVFVSVGHDADATAGLSSALGVLHVHGVSVTWEAAHGNSPRCSPHLLPRHPRQSTPFWPVHLRHRGPAGAKSP